jgi:ligand-binding SRPBCC domain-containing protein
MISGAFKSMVHDHRFDERPEGTLMSDRFEFKSPLGTLGAIADWLFLNSYMRRFIIRRSTVLKQLAESGDWSHYVQHAFVSFRSRNSHS